MHFDAARGVSRAVGVVAFPRENVRSMIRLRGFTQPEAYRGGIVAIGNFDGVHRGHQAMIAQLCRRAREYATSSVVLTFDPHPISLLRPEHTPPPLSTLERKQELLERCGVACTIAYPTDHALLQLTPEDFFRRIVIGELAACGMVEGPNFYFGKDRAGNVETLGNFCRDSGIFLDVLAPIETPAGMISSSAIRGLLKAGRVRDAIELLGHPYQVSGLVASGAQRGRALGFPTANLEDVQTLLPAEGVYAGVAFVEDRAYAAAIHLGPNPTFADDARKLEVHLIDFAGDLYGSRLKVEFLSELRAVVRFDSTEALRRQLIEDISRVKLLVSTPATG